MKKFVPIVLCLVLFAGLAGLDAQAKTKFGLAPFETKQTLRLGFFVGSPLSIPFYIADKEGFFKELNIDVKYQTFTNGPAMMEANADWDMAGAGEGGLLVGMVGFGLKVIGISDYEKNLALFARKGQPHGGQSQGSEGLERKHLAVPDGDHGSGHPRRGPEAGRSQRLRRQVGQHGRRRSPDRLQRKAG